MPNWFDQVNPKFVKSIANKYMFEGGIEAFDIIPKVGVNAKTGYVVSYDKADWAKIGTVADYIMAGAVESIGDDFGISKIPYYVKKFAFHKDVTEDEAKEYDSPVDPISDATQFVTNRLKRVLLLNVVNTFLTSGVWSADNDLTSYKWDTVTDGVSVNNPIKAIRDAALLIYKTTGYKPNKLLVTPDVHNALTYNTFITNSIKYTDDKVVTEALLKRLFDLDQYKVLGAINTSSTDWIATKQALLIYTPSAPSRSDPSAAYHITTLQGRGGEVVDTKTIPVPLKNNALRIEGAVYTAPLKISSDLGVRFYNCI